MDGRAYRYTSSTYYRGYNDFSVCAGVFLNVDPTASIGLIKAIVIIEHGPTIL